MSKFMEPVFQFYRGSSIFRLKNPKLVPQCLWSCNCHTGPSVLEANDLRRISNNQVDTPECLLCMTHYEFDFIHIKHHSF